MQRARALIPPVVSGYALGNKRGYFRFIKAEATENLLSNPSFEHPFGAFAIPTGYSTTAAALVTQSLARQRRGYKAGEVILGAATEEGIYTTFSATAGQSYTFSADLLGAGGDTYRMYFATNLGVRVGGVVTVKSRGRWQRPHVSFMAQSTATHRVYLTRANGGSLRNFYTDGWQVENKPYPTTYCDGSLTGFVDNRIDFYWRGGEHSSASVRIAQSRAGGREYDLRDYGFALMGISGLGYEGVINYKTPLANGGAYYQGSNKGEGSLTIMGAIQANDPQMLAYYRVQIEQLINFEQVSPPQPMLITYNLEECDAWDSECLEIVAIPESMPQSTDNDYQERVAITFSIPTRYAARRCGDVGVELAYQLSVSDADFALKRDASGVWSALSTGATGGAVRGYKRLPDGTYLVYGDFTSFAGVANTAGIALYNPQTNAITSVATLGGGTKTVNCVALAPNGDAYAGGAFTDVNGIANTARIAMRSFATGLWSSIANPSSSSVISALHYAIDGSLFVGSSSGGVGMTIGGIGPTTIAIRSAGGVWSATPALSNFIIQDIQGALDGTVYASENVSGIYRWTGAAWSAITTGTPSATSLLFTPDGRLYFALANSPIIGGVTVNYCGYYNGVTFYPLGAGFNNNALKVAYSAQDGLIYYSGTYTTADGITLPDATSAWNGSAHIPLDVDLPGAGNVNDIFAPSPDYLFLGFSTNGTAIAAGITSITNPGTANAYPVVTIEGPGRLFQVKNYTTGTGVYFNITLLAGEIITLDFASPRGAVFTSNFRGNIAGYVLAGSNTDFYFVPGANSFSLFVTGDTPGTTNAHLVFRPRFSTLSAQALERLNP